MNLIRSSCVALLLLAGCGEGDDPVLAYDAPVAKVSPAAITAFPGDPVRLRLTDGQGRPVRPVLLGSSSGAAVVDTGGLVTAIAAGASVVCATVPGTGGQTVTPFVRRAQVPRVVTLANP